MAADINSVTLVARLTRDPEVRTTAGGSSVANLRVAFTTRQKQDDTWVDKSNYADAVLFGSMADNAAKYLAKGRRVGIDGRLSWSEWKAQDGTNRQRLEIVVQDLQYLDSNPAANAGATNDDMPINEPVAGAAAASDDTPF